MINKAKPGYHVEKCYYGFNIAQARARAIFLAGEYGRPVAVSYVDMRGNVTVVETHGGVTA